MSALKRSTIFVLLTLLPISALVLATGVAARDFGRTGPTAETTWTSANVVYTALRAGMSTAVDVTGDRAAVFEVESDGFDVSLRIGTKDEVLLFDAEMFHAQTSAGVSRLSHRRSFVDWSIVIDGIPFLIRRGTVWATASGLETNQVNVHIRGLAHAHPNNKDPDLTVSLELMTQISSDLRVLGFWFSFSHYNYQTNHSIHLPAR
jgi:hypothetical protein